MTELDWTGERLVTQVPNLYGTIEHLHRYAFATELCNNKIVLDIASGEGYGTNLLSLKAEKVFGVDISEEAISHAKKKYTSTNIIFRVGEASNIPIEDNLIDVVVSFETIEHHVEHDKMISEIKRVLKPSGLLIISSPEKSIYKDRDPNNPFHLKEITVEELQFLISKNFKYFKLYKQRFVIGSVISIEDNQANEKFKFYDGSFAEIKDNLNYEEFFNKPFFNIMVCSNIDAFNYNYLAPGISIFSGYNAYESEKDSMKYELINMIKNVYIHSTTFIVGKVVLLPLKYINSFFKKRNQ